MLHRPPLSIEPTASAVTLWLDTPGASVNVFGVEAAQQLDLWLADWEKRPPPLVLVRSRKPDSFVNGAGLLMASAMKSPEHARALSAPVRDVYDRLSALDVPTVAFIEGNCFGCGLELALACRHRIARPTVQTLFVMTELRDYRFVPLFGGTYRLPRALGVKAAAALLLGGEIWDAHEAKRRDLVHALVTSRDAAELDRVVETLVRPRGPKRSRRPAGASGKVPPALVQAQPPVRRPLYAMAAQLLERGVRGPIAAASKRELEAFAQTVTAEPAKRAMGFFFVRHMARSHLFGSTERGRGERRLELLSPGRTRGAAPELAALQQRLHAGAEEDGRATLTLGPPGAGAEVSVGFAGPLRRREAVDVIFPFGVERGAPCEVLLGDRAHVLEPLARELDYQGFEVITAGAALGPQVPEHRFATERLLTCAVAAWHVLLQEGATPAAIASSLWAAGMTRAPEEVLAAVGSAPAELRRWRVFRKAARKTSPDAFAATCEALTEEVRRLLDDGVVAHPSIADVLVSTLFGFPLEEGSLLLRADRLGASPGHYRS